MYNYTIYIGIYKFNIIYYFILIELPLTNTINDNYGI